MFSLFLWFVVLHEIHGDLIFPAIYAFRECTEMANSQVNRNLSSANCPMSCISMRGICDCRNSTTSGVLIDNVIPNLNVSQTGVWASQLYATCGTSSTQYLGFKFNTEVTLYKVVIFMFVCYDWNLPGVDLLISIYSSLNFESFQTSIQLGNITINETYSNCHSLTAIRVDKLHIISSDQYVIELKRLSNGVGKIYIGEIQFENEYTTTVVLTSRTPAIQPSLTSFSQTNHPTQIEITAEYESSDTYDILELSYMREFSNLGFNTADVSITTTTTSDQYGTNQNTTKRVCTTENCVGFSTTMSLYENNNSNKTNIGNHKNILIAIYVSVTCISATCILIIVVLVLIVCRNKSKNVPRKKEPTDEYLGLDDIEPADDNTINDFSLINDHNRSAQNDYDINNLETSITLSSATNEQDDNLTISAKFMSSFKRKMSFAKSHSNSTIPCLESSMLTNAGNTGYLSLDENQEKLASGQPVHTNQPNWTENSQYETVTASIKAQTVTSENPLYDSVVATKRRESSHSVDHPAISESAADAKEEEPLYSPLYSLVLSDEITVPIIQPRNIKVIKTLGVGFFGKVLLGEPIDSDTSTTSDNLSSSEKKRKKVAIKMLKPGSSVSVKMSFYKELKFMSRLEHDNVVKVLGACTDKEPFIMMEYIENGDLSSFLQNFDDICDIKSQSSEFIIHISTLKSMCIQIACGMKYLSSKNYIHRDLAARNVLVGDNNIVKISDFGMSRNLYSSHYYVMASRGAVPIRWMARECFSKKFTSKSDVWSFGVTMWEVFTLGKNAPYEEMTDFEVLQDTVKAERKLLSVPDKCPSDVSSIMLKCWRDDPDDRPDFDTLYDLLLPLSCENVQ